MAGAPAIGGTAPLEQAAAAWSAIYTDAPFIVIERRRGSVRGSPRHRTRPDTRAPLSHRQHLRNFALADTSCPLHSGFGWRRLPFFDCSGLPLPPSARKRMREARVGVATTSEVEATLAVRLLPTSSSTTLDRLAANLRKPQEETGAVMIGLSLSGDRGAPRILNAARQKIRMQGGPYAC